MKEIYWTGVRESDIAFDSDLFKGSITFFGSNRNGNRAFCAENGIRLNHNIENDDVSAFIIKCQREILLSNPGTKFIAYNPNNVFNAPDDILSASICLNEQTLMERLDNKLSFRELLLEHSLPCLPYKIIKGSDISSFFANNVGKRFVVQNPDSSGGDGTRVWDGENWRLLFNGDLPVDMSSDTEYIISEYVFENIPINIHGVIYEDKVLLLPPSVQIVVLTGSEKSGYKLLYRGADYISYNDINSIARANFARSASYLCDILRNLGYRGVVGIDAMAIGDEVYIQEVNNRFQGSTYPLSCALKENGLPTVAQLNYEAFGFAKTTANFNDFNNLEVKYSYFSFTHMEDIRYQKYFYERLKTTPEVEQIEEDGVDFSIKIQENALLFNTLFSTKLLSVFGCEARLNPFLIGHKSDFRLLVKSAQEFSAKGVTALKTALINDGVSLSDKAKIELSKTPDFSSYISLDIEIAPKVLANAPLFGRFRALTPFELDFVDKTGYFIKYYGEKLLPVNFMPKPVLTAKFTGSGHRMNDIAYFSTDRLRLQNSPTCVFNAKKSACLFCENAGIDNDFNLSDIIETIDACFEIKPTPFRHILIGGRSAAIGKEKRTLIAMCERIRHYDSKMNIYVMCLPPIELRDIDDYVSAGVTEFGFNIEIYDREIARRYMPAKGMIPIEQYLSAIERAVSLLGNTGAVRSAFVVGLEPLASLKKGIDIICSLGAAPILSAFRPIAGTPMANVANLPTSEIYIIIKAAEEICASYKLHLGPNCVECQNNTLNSVLLE